MRKFPFREFALLSLPVLIFAGVAYWKSLERSPSVHLLRPFYNGPAVLEVSNIRAADPTPYEVWKGYTWKTVADVEGIGSLIWPAGWQPKLMSSVISPNLELVYRQSGDWRLAGPGISIPPMKAGTEGQAQFVTVSLNGVPRNASEVMLRGHYTQTQYFDKTMPPAFVAKNSGVKLVGSGLQIDSDPFEIEIKGAGKPFPAPNVSRVSPLQLRGQLHTWDGPKERMDLAQREDEFLLNLHHTSNPNWASSLTVTKENVRLYDGLGRRLQLYAAPDRKRILASRSIADSASYAQEIFSPQKPKDDLITGIFSASAVPQRPWPSYPQPLRIELDVSDGTGWPLHVKTTFDLRKPDGPIEKFGAPAK